MVPLEFKAHTVLFTAYWVSTYLFSIYISRRLVLTDYSNEAKGQGIALNYPF